MDLLSLIVLQLILVCIFVHINTNEDTYGDWVLSLYAILFMAIILTTYRLIYGDVLWQMIDF